METKSQKFQRLKDARLPKAVKAIELLENLNGSAYEYTDQEAKDMVAELEAAILSVKEAFGVAPKKQTAKAEPKEKHRAPLQLKESYARWAYDKLKSGKTKEGTDLLKKALTEFDDT